MTSALFHYVHAAHETRPWGRFLDAGSGVNSSVWSTQLETSEWCGVTGSTSHAAQIRTAVADRLRPQDRLLVGNWMDESLLGGEVFDTVLADYLVGAIEGFSPYFQSQLFARLRPLVGQRLYIIGLDPYIVGDAPDEAARLVRAIGRLRDACLLLADETPYREYPAEWVGAAVARGGFRLVSAKRFANRYRERWVNSQLDMAVRRLPKLEDQRLAASLAQRIEDLRGEALAFCAKADGLRHGFDYVMACEPA